MLGLVVGWNVMTIRRMRIGASPERPTDFVGDPATHRGIFPRVGDHVVTVGGEAVGDVLDSREPLFVVGLAAGRRVQLHKESIYYRDESGIIRLVCDFVGLRRYVMPQADRCI